MTELPSIPSDSVDLTGKCVRFARDIKSEVDCAVPIHICETRTVQVGQRLQIEILKTRSHEQFRCDFLLSTDAYE